MGSDAEARKHIWISDYLNFLADTGSIVCDEYGQITQDSPMTKAEVQALEDYLSDLDETLWEPQPDPPATGPDYDLFPD